VSILKNRRWICKIYVVYVPDALIIKREKERCIVYSIHLFFLCVPDIRMNYRVQVPNCEDGSSDLLIARVCPWYWGIRRKLAAKHKVNVRNEGEYLEFDEHFRPTCLLEYSYCYDSFVEKYRTLKFARTKECVTCLIRDDSLFQKVFKIQCGTQIHKKLRV